MDMMQNLNPQQRQAVTQGDGPVLIVAGPGTGKTKTLTARIAHLVNQGVAPSRILALTFTVKAAREMSERVSALLGESCTVPISTFHSLGHTILSQLQPSQPLRFVDEPERLSIIRGLNRPAELKGATARELSLLLSRQKGMIHSADDGAAIGTLLKRYQQALRAQGVLDYDDLLYRAYHALATHPAQPSVWQTRYDYLLIDEFQDTNELQWELIHAIRGNDNVFVIGDPKQSIYGFRGASAAMFERFKHDFPHHQQVTLHTNYRSDTAIVSLASAIFGGPDALTAHSVQQGEVSVVKTLNEHSEADFVLQQIEQGIGGSDLLKAAESRGQRLSDFAILYRTHQVARVLQRRLHDSGIPFQVVGEGSPYDQPDIQAIVESLRWFAGGELPVIKGLTAVQVRALLEPIDTHQPPSSLARVVADTCRTATDTASSQRLNQLMSTLVRFDAQPDGLRASLRYIDQLAEEEFYDPSAEAVTLLTIHASKGLEFGHVILIAAEEGTLPHIRKTRPTDFEEEKRLFYVAATRARHHLDIVHAAKRAGEGREPSRFVRQIDQGVLPRRDDPNLAQIQKRLRRREQKARQATLF